MARASSRRSDVHGRASARPVGKPVSQGGGRVGVPVGDHDAGALVGEAALRSAAPMPAPAPVTRTTLSDRSRCSTCMGPPSLRSRRRRAGPRRRLVGDERVHEPGPRGRRDGVGLVGAAGDGDDLGDPRSCSVVIEMHQSATAGSRTAPLRARRGRWSRCRPSPRRRPPGRRPAGECGLSEEPSSVPGADADERAGDVGEASVVACTKSLSRSARARSGAVDHERRVQGVDRPAGGLAEPADEVHGVSGRGRRRARCRPSGRPRTAGERADDLGEGVQGAAPRDAQDVAFVSRSESRDEHARPSCVRVRTGSLSCR